jgi:putative cell wall-binding protein
MKRRVGQVCLLTLMLLLVAAVVPLTASAITMYKAGGGSVTVKDSDVIAPSVGAEKTGIVTPRAGNSAPPDAYEPDGPAPTWANLGDLNTHLPRFEGYLYYGADVYTQAHTIDTANATQWDEDWFKLTVPAGEFVDYDGLSYMIDAYATDPTVDLCLDVYANGVLINQANSFSGVDPSALVSNDDAPWQYYSTYLVGRSSSVSFIPPAAGVYWVRVRPYHSSSTAFVGNAGAYTLRIKVGQIMRVEGANRIDTAIRTVREGWPDAPGGPGSTNTTVTLAYAYDYPDALSAASLAGACGGPVLLCPGGTSLPTNIRDEIRRIGARGVYVIGGANRISNEVFEDLQVAAPGIRVERIAGSPGLGTPNSRIGTAIEVMKKVKQLTGAEFSKTAFIATGFKYADALALSSMAYYNRVPILLTHQTYLDSEVANALAANGFTDVVIAGGTTTVYPAVQTALEDDVAIPHNRILRLAGHNRYETAKMIASWACDLTGPGARGDSEVGTLNNTTALTSLPRPYLNAYVTGEGFADALAAGPLAGKTGAPILLAPKGWASEYLFGADDELPVGSTSWFSDLWNVSPKQTPIRRSYVFGGPGTISDDCFGELDSWTGFVGGP